MKLTSVLLLLCSVPLLSACSKPSIGGNAYVIKGNGDINRRQARLSI